MLRDLNENEMEMVSGGGTVSDCVGSADGTTVTCTYHEGNTEIITYGGIGGGSLPQNDTFGDPHVGLGVFGQIGLGDGGGGSSGGSTATSDEDAPNDEGCRPPPLGFDSWSAYYADLNSRAPTIGNEGNAGFQVAGGIIDVRNISLGCNFDNP